MVALRLQLWQRWQHEGFQQAYRRRLHKTALPTLRHDQRILSTQHPPAARSCTARRLRPSASGCYAASRRDCGTRCWRSREPTPCRTCCSRTLRSLRCTPTRTRSPPTGGFHGCYLQSVQRDRVCQVSRGGSGSSVKLQRAGLRMVQQSHPVVTEIGTCKGLDGECRNRDCRCRCRPPTQIMCVHAAGSWSRRWTCGSRTSGTRWRARSSAASSTTLAPPTAARPTRPCRCLATPLFVLAVNSQKLSFCTFRSVPFEMLMPIPGRFCPFAFQQRKATQTQHMPHPAHITCCAASGRTCRVNCNALMRLSADFHGASRRCWAWRLSCML